ncbi:transposase, partial [Bacillus cereus]|uniref:helix-turn-helix domain-containing protein n=1 Tax=Bacillus cereus TaxID=1396 RepID=UPI00113CE44E
MTKQNKAYKFRLYPTGDQAHLIRKTFGCVRFVYNRRLAERKEAYERYKDD